MTESVPIKSAYEYLLTQGVLGVLCVLLIFALVWTVKNLLKSKDERVHDQKKYTEALHDLNEAVRELAIELNKSSSAMTHEVLRSNDLTRTTLGTLEKSQDNVARSLDSLKNEQVRLGATLTSRGF